MLTFLRKIRKTLIESGSTRKYLFYAIGEIALVVIGILIALQINNWNEGKKDRIKESKVLEQIAKTIVSNSDHFTSSITKMKRNYERTDEVISIIEDKRPYENSMNQLFHSVRVVQRLRVSSTGYEELKNTGFDILQSASLKEDIVNLFEFTYSQTDKILNEVQLYDDHFTKFIIDNFLEVEHDLLKPVTYNQIINSHFYYSSLLHIRSIRYWRILLLEKAKEENSRTLRLIKDELGEED